MFLWNSFEAFIFHVWGRMKWNACIHALVDNCYHPRTYIYNNLRGTAYNLQIKKTHLNLDSMNFCISHTVYLELTNLNNNFSGIKSLVKIIFSYCAEEFCHVYIIKLDAWKLVTPGCLLLSLGLLWKHNLSTSENI